MTPDTKRKIQLVLGLAIAVAAFRTGYILYQRHADRVAHTKPFAPPLKADYYVTPKKLYPYDLKSARQLTQQPVWVKVGYAYTYFPYNVARRHADFSHEAGQLLPIEKLQITDVVTDATPGARDEKQVLAIFEKEGATYALSIGSLKDETYQIRSDDMLFIQDPHLLYNHWPAEVWDAIDKHQVQAGMSELQADFAIGLGVPDKSRDPDNRIVNYPNGGKPLMVTYRDGKAVDVKAGPSV
jgi:hypothetical protein